MMILGHGRLHVAAIGPKSAHPIPKGVQTPTSHHHGGLEDMSKVYLGKVANVAREGKEKKIEIRSSSAVAAESVAS